MNKSEIYKKNIANQDFNLLLTPGVTGYYQGCEITQVFIFDKRIKKTKNFYTLFCFDELETLYDLKTDFISTERIGLSNDFLAGIIRKRITISTAKQMFMDIQSGKLVIDDSCSISPELILVPKVFVANKDSNETSFVNYMLKPNYWGDNYIIEFFDKEKKIFDDEDSEILISKLKKEILKYCPINFEKTYDRIGNIIFQFPITEIKYGICSDDTLSQIHFKLERHPKTINNNIQINVKACLDDTITGFNMIESKMSSIDHCFVLGDDNNVHTEVINLKNNTILQNNSYHFIRNFNFNGLIGSQYSEPRTIIYRDGITSEKIELFSNMNTQYSSRNIYYDEIIRKRRQNNEIIQKSNDYFVYNEDNDKATNIQNAFNFIHSKLERISDIKEICLWDPYLCAADIIETLYWEKTGIPFRCITEVSNIKKKINKSKFQKITEILFSKKKRKKRDIFSEVKIEQKEYFLSHSNNLNVKLKFLGQHDGYGFKFHDRFIIFIPYDPTNIPTVYSLGISVNQLGSSHHMIQKVPDPRLILHNFELLWNEFDNTDCLIMEF